MLSILGKDGTAEIESEDWEKIAALAEQLGVTEPTPLQQFRDAKYYRERLSLQRYDTILDDSHDIGYNTLHRMNFRLTLSPARKRSDSIAAVSVRVREPRDPRLLFDHYGRLVVETRKRMSELVKSLMADRMTVLESKYEFLPSELDLIDQLLHDKVSEIVRVDNGFQNDATISLEADNLIDHLIDLILEQQADLEEAQARSFLYRRISDIGNPSLTSELLQDYPKNRLSYWKQSSQLTRYAVNATQNLIDRCDVPTSLLKLSPRDFSGSSKRFYELQTEYINSLVDAASAENGGDGDKTDEQLQKEVKQRRQKLRAFKARLASSFAETLARDFSYRCSPTNMNQIILAKLRLLGRLQLLERTSEQSLASCASRDFGMREEYLAFIGGEMPPPEQKAALEDACPNTSLFDTTQILANRVAITGNDYARIGIVMAMHHKLSNLQLDTSSSNLKLGDYFDFDVTNCNLKSCDLRTRSKAEALAGRSIHVRQAARKLLQSTDERETNLVSAFKSLENSIAPKDKSSHRKADALDSDMESKPVGPSNDNYLLRRIRLEKELSEMERRIQEAGREEALRLYLKLRCFADARSYTVWPRSGERLATLERDSSQSGARFDIDSTLQKFIGLQASSDASSILRQERDHIFGIGDWGNDPKQFEKGSDEELKPCTKELEAFLDSYKPNGTFIGEYASDVHQSTLAPTVKTWWKKVEKEFETDPSEKCEKVDCKMGLEDLMRIAHRLELPNAETNFSWIIAPRRETPQRATRHVPMSLPLSALISLPSWWGHAELEIATCWVRPKDLRNRITQGDLCGDPDEPKKRGYASHVARAVAG